MVDSGCSKTSVFGTARSSNGGLTPSAAKSNAEFLKSKYSYYYTINSLYALK